MTRQGVNITGTGGQFDRNIQIVQILLNSGANPDLQDNDGNTALISALKNYSGKEIAIILINSGADVNICNKNKVYPIMIAREKSYFDIVETYCRKTYRKGSRNLP